MRIEYDHDICTVLWLKGFGGDTNAGFYGKQIYTAPTHKDPTKTLVEACNAYAKKRYRLKYIEQCSVVCAVTCSPAEFSEGQKKAEDFLRKVGFKPNGPHPSDKYLLPITVWVIGVPDFLDYIRAHGYKPPYDRWTTKDDAEPSIFDDDDDDDD